MTSVRVKFKNYPWLNSCIVSKGRKEYICSECQKTIPKGIKSVNRPEGISHNHEKGRYHLDCVEDFYYPIEITHRQDKFTYTINIQCFVINCPLRPNKEYLWKWCRECKHHFDGYCCKTR